MENKIFRKVIVIIITKVNPHHSSGAPADVELVEGYGIFTAKRCIDDAVDNCRNSPTRLIRNLIGIFFSDNVLCESNTSGKGKRQHKPLDQDILRAYYSQLTNFVIIIINLYGYTFFTEFVINRFPQTAKPNLIDAVNDCCCNARRQKNNCGTVEQLTS